MLVLANLNELFAILQWRLAHRFFELHGEGTLVVKTKRKGDVPDGQEGVVK